MAVIDIIAVVVLVVYALIGATKGFVKSIFGLLSVAVAVLVASWIGGEIGALISSIPAGEGATLGSNLSLTVQEFLSSKGEIFSVVPTGGYTEGVIIDALSVAGIPAIIGGMIAGPIAEALVDVNGVSLSQAVAPVLSELLFTVIGFIVVFILVWILLKVVCKIIKKALETFKVLKAVDVVFGFVFGIVKGGIVICIPLALLSALNFIPGLNELIAESTIVSWIANNNFISGILSSGFDIKSIVDGVISGLSI